MPFPATRQQPWAAVLATLIGGATVLAQQAGQTQAPVFRADAPGVEIDVRVFDRDGRFIDTLDVNDFELLEDGTPQQLTAVTLVGGTATADTTAPPVTSRSAMPIAPVRQTWIFAFDLNHLTPGNGFNRARAAVETYLKQDFKEGDLGGVLAGARMVNNRLTSVRDELVKAAASVTPSSEPRSHAIELTREWPRLRDESEAFQIANGDRDALQRAVIRACNDDSSACRVVSPDTAILEKAQRLSRDTARTSNETLKALNALAAGLARLPGPKTIVLLTEGIVTQDQDTALRSVVGQLARAGARVYAIDVRGLNRGPSASIGDQPTTDNPAGGPPSMDIGEDGPNSLAVDTGGFFVRNENNLNRAMASIAADANTYYVIGYQPTDTKFDGKYRSVEVRLKGHPDAVVRARRGYLALEPAQMLTPRAAGGGNPTAPASAAATPPVDLAPPVDPRPPTPTPTPTPTPAPRGSTTKNPSGGESVSASEAMRRLRPDAIEKATTLAGLAGDDLKNVDAIASQGWSAYQRGDVETAAAALGRAAESPTVRPWVVYVLGLSDMALGRVDEAISSWERVRSAAPEFLPVYMDLAGSYAQRADLTSALGVLRDAERRWPRDPDVQNAIGVILVRRGVLDDAINAFEAAMLAAPDDPVAYLNLGRAHEMRYTRSRRYVDSQQRWVAPDGDRKKAIEYFQRYVDLEGPYADQAIDAIARLKWSGK